MASLSNNSLKGLQFSPAEQAILTTLLYSDIFSFPLTRDELWRFLISEKKISKEAFDKGLHALNKQITLQKNYFCIKGREAIISQRIQRLTEVNKKLQRARFVASKLAVIPSILFIGITGGLAVGNVSASDDIDLVIITKKGTLFMTRLFVLVILELLGVRRFRMQTNTADTICANLLFDETALFWFANNKNIYTAREIAQIQPLFERGQLYHKFLKANAWIKLFLPNSSSRVSLKIPFTKSLFPQILFFAAINPVFEAISCLVQMSWMSRHQTKEILTKELLAFHPNDYRTKTLKQLRLKMQEFGLLTKF